jgi:hypothetical protein
VSDEQKDESYEEKAANYEGRHHDDGCDPGGPLMAMARVFVLRKSRSPVRPMQVGFFMGTQLSGNTFL